RNIEDFHEVIYAGAREGGKQIMSPAAHSHGALVTDRRGFGMPRAAWCGRTSPWRARAGSREGGGDRSPRAEPAGYEGRGRLPASLPTWRGVWQAALGDTMS